ncbi:MAG: ECF transporter S component [Candidatus Dormibacteraeota bacterium]|uniref:ECF transporter S component n=1 Tax=Candidatus Amunia macphersoniae TaxID=3127014 RepID=A0A934NAW7_9BACT|nr:ECF transporter S component [Candidatus Dormibacteraeota bacterium]
MRLAAVTVAGAALFLWPFTGLGGPGLAAAAAVSSGCVLALLAVETMSRRLDSRGLALIAAIAAVDSALRLALVSGIGGFSPIFLLVLCAGYAMGAEFGFVCGATALLVSALVTAGVGPWLPYEMIATGWVGAAAGLAGAHRRGRTPQRRDVLLLAVVGVACGFAYGAVMDIWDWTFFRGAADVGYLPGLGAAATASRFGHFYLATSLVYDGFRAAGNALLVLLLGAPVLGALVRLQRRHHLVIEDSPALPGAAPAAQPG